MQSNYQTYHSFSSDKINISEELSMTCKMIKDINSLKKRKIYKSRKYSINLSNYYTNSILSSFDKNIKYKILESSKKKHNYYLPEFSNLKTSNTIQSLPNSNSIIKSPNINKTQNSSFFTISVNKTPFFKGKSKNQISVKQFLDLNYNFFNKEKYRIKNYRSNLSSSRAESNSEFCIKSKNLFYSNYINNVQKKEVKTQSERIQNKKCSLDIEISHLKRMIKYLTSFIKDEKEYIEHLKLILKEETQINLILIEKLNFLFQDSFMLRFKLQKIKRCYEKSFNNKFFLLCVKNGTNQFNEFKKEDQEDILFDKNTLDLLSNYPLIEQRLYDLISKKCYENLSLEETEIFIFGKKLIKIPPKQIFSSTENFELKLKKIQSRIKYSLYQYNQSQKILNAIREEYKEKLNLILKDSEINKFYKEEIEKNDYKLNDVKIKNMYLKNYIKNIPRTDKTNNIQIVEDKIMDIYYEIYKVYPFEIKRGSNVKMTILTYLQDIERLYNQLIKKKKDELINNKEAYINLTKKFKKEKRIEAIKKLKEKQKREIEKRINKVLFKNIKINIKAKKKVPEKFYFHKKKQIFKTKSNDEITLTYE